MEDHKTTAVPQITTAAVNINLSKGAIPIIISIILKIGGITKPLCVFVLIQSFKQSLRHFSISLLFMTFVIKRTSIKRD